MNCPNCGSALKQVSVAEHYYNKEVQIEQCSACGGLWFDKDEFFRVKIGEATRLEKIDLSKLATPTPLKKELMDCPKDGHPLKPFKDVYSPKELKNISLMTCDTCGGFWFNHGEFTKFQGNRAEEELQENGSASLVKSIANLEAYRDDMQRVQQLQPVGIRGVQLYGGGEIESAARSGEPFDVYTLIDIVLSILRVLVLR